MFTDCKIEPSVLLCCIEYNIMYYNIIRTVCTFNRQIRFQYLGNFRLYFFCCSNIFLSCLIKSGIDIGMMPGKRRRGHPRIMQYIDNIKKWTKASLEENVSVLRLTEDRTSWRERNCAAGAANVRTVYTD